MRTTGKEFKERVRTSIILALPCEQLLPAELQELVNEFKNYDGNYRPRNEFEAVKDFLQGLPSCINLPFYYDDQRQLLAAWHEQTEEEADKYTDEQVTQQFYWLVYRELVQLLKREKLSFR